MMNGVWISPLWIRRSCPV